MIKKLILLAIAGLCGACIMHFASAQSATDTQGSDISSYKSTEESTDTNKEGSALYEKSSGMIQLDTSSDGAILEEEKDATPAKDSDQG